jgi:hypothetical protein
MARGLFKVACLSSPASAGMSCSLMMIIMTTLIAVPVAESQSASPLPALSC